MNVLPRIDTSQLRYKYCSICLFLILLAITTIGVLLSGRTKETFENLERFQNSDYMQVQNNPAATTTCYTGFRT